MKSRCITIGETPAIMHLDSNNKISYEGVDVETVWENEFGNSSKDVREFIEWVVTTYRFFPTTINGRSFVNPPSNLYLTGEVELEEKRGFQTILSLSSISSGSAKKQFDFDFTQLWSQCARR